MDKDDKIEAAIIAKLQLPSFKIQRTSELFFTVRKTVKNKYMVREEVVRRIAYLRDTGVIVHCGRRQNEDRWKLSSDYEEGNGEG